MSKFNIFFINILLTALLLGASPIRAADLPRVPYAYPFDEGETARALNSQPVVIELFTSLDCLFCPRAEALLADLAAKTRAITLACSVDPEGAAYPLGRSVCSDRQGRYAEWLSDGLMYTPQMVINGHIEAVGHEFDDVALGLKAGTQEALVTPKLLPSSEAGVYTLDLPKIDLQGHTADIWLAAYRKPYTVPKTMRQSAAHPDPLVRVVDRLTPVAGWDGKPKKMPVSITPGEGQAGFVILVQRDDGNIVAAVDTASLNAAP